MAAFISDRPIRIGIVDGNDRFRCILHTSLDLLPNFKVVAEAKNGEEAIAMVEYVHPDVVLMDIDLPSMNGIEATRVIHSRFSDTEVIILTLQSGQTASDRALQAGACQFLNKYCGQERLYHSIKECSPGPTRVVGNSPH